MPNSASASESSAGERLSLLRILDAAANRASEGLRVIEDYVRFVLDDRHLTEIAKKIRHELTAALRAVGPLERQLARETQADVGTEVTTPSESVRSDAWSVAAASFHRVQQALRSLEEYGKVLAPELATRSEQLRYSLYTLQRAADITRDALERLADARLYVLIDGCDSPEELRRLLTQLVAARVDVVQLRDKRLNDRELTDRAILVRELTRETETLFIMNDRPDVALVSHADGVHVGQEELSVKEVRAVMGTHPLVGVSTHTIEQARQAVLDGASYIGVGPTFPSATKRFEQFAGLDFVRAVAQEIRLPAFAIGGIHQDNVREVRAAGLSRVAVSAAITAAENPQGAAEELRLRLRD